MARTDILAALDIQKKELFWHLWSYGSKERKNTVIWWMTFLKDGTCRLNIIWNGSFLCSLWVSKQCNAAFWLVVPVHVGRSQSVLFYVASFLLRHHSSQTFTYMVHRTGVMLGYRVWFLFGALQFRISQFSQKQNTRHSKQVTWLRSFVTNCSNVSCQTQTFVPVGYGHGFKTSRGGI